jgi:hypothetical protein
MTERKKYVRPEPMSKDKLREMLAQAVRNTQPELNLVQAAVPEPKAKLRGRQTTRPAGKRPIKSRKGRGGAVSMNLFNRRFGRPT